MIRRRDILKGAAALSGAAILGACGHREVISGKYRYLATTGLPDHPTGAFPNPGCPNAVGERDRTLRMPLNPVANVDLTAIQAWEFGVAVNGVSLDPAGPWWKGDPSLGWHFEVMSAVAGPYLGLDDNFAHVQPGGRYHYHALPQVLLERGEEDHKAGRMHLLGWAADGFPIYSRYGHSVADDLQSPLVELKPSYRLMQGARSDGPPGHHDGTFVQDFEFVGGLGDLDPANARFGATPEFPGGTVYYVFSQAFPFIPRFWHGTPDPSFATPIGPTGTNGLPIALQNYAG
jgi:hypothetical protein